MRHGRKPLSLDGCYISIHREMSKNIDKAAWLGQAQRALRKSYLRIAFGEALQRLYSPGVAQADVDHRQGKFLSKDRGAQLRPICFQAIAALRKSPLRKYTRPAKESRRAARSEVASLLNSSSSRFSAVA